MAAAREESGPRGKRERILVIRAGALGDVLLSRTALACLRRRFRDAELTLVAPLPQGETVLWDGLADRVLGFDEPALGPLVTGAGREWPRLLDRPDRLVVWLRDHEAVQANAALLGVRDTLGCAPLEAIPARRHVAEWLAASLAPVCECEGPPPALEAPGTPEHSGRYVVLHPGSGSARKNYPNWSAVVGRLDLDLSVYVPQGPADGAAVDALLAAWPAALAAPRRVRAPSLAALARLVARAALYLGNDSGVSHLAAAVGAPAVVVFGPTDPEIWKPVGPRVTTLGGTRVANGIFADSPVWPATDEVIEAAERALE